MKIEMIKSYIEKHLPSYDYLVDGSVKVSWKDPTIKEDEVWVEATYHSNYHHEKIVIDLIDLLAFVFEMNIDRKNEN